MDDTTARASVECTCLEPSNPCPVCQDLADEAAESEERQLADWAEAQGERFDPAFGDYNLNPGGL